MHIAYGFGSGLQPPFSSPSAARPAGTTFDFGEAWRRERAVDIMPGHMLALGGVFTCEEILFGFLLPPS